MKKYLLVFLSMLSLSTVLAACQTEEPDEDMENAPTSAEINNNDAGDNEMEDNEVDDMDDD